MLEAVCIVCSTILICAVLLTTKGITINTNHHTDAPAPDHAIYKQLFEQANEETVKEQPDFKEVLAALDKTYEEELDYGSRPKE
jgi:hypothetical protein